MENSAQRGQVTYPDNLLGTAPSSAPSVAAYRLGTVSTARIFVLGGPGFDGESTPSQFPSLTDFLGVSANALSSRKPSLGLSQPIILPYIQVPSPPSGSSISCLCIRVISACIHKTVTFLDTCQLLLGQEHIHINFYMLPKYLGPSPLCFCVNE